MKVLLSLLLVPFLIYGCQTNQPALTSFVNPFIGTAGGAHTYPGATIPFGMVQLSPDIGNNSSDEFYSYRNGHQYDYLSTEIQGFGHLHLSGTAGDPEGDISVMPMTGKVPSAQWIKSSFSHQEESAAPGYYSVMLKDFNILAELTTTLRCGFHRYTFPESKQAIIRFDLGYHNGGKPLESRFKRLNDSTFVGSRFSTGYADDKRVCFAVRTSKPIKELFLFADSSLVSSKNEVKAVGVKSCLQFDTKNGEQILMKVALSFANEAGALAGLAEIPDWDFEAVRQKASAAWEKELQKIVITSPDAKVKEIFYTAIYHSYVASIRFDDAAGNYRGADGQLHRSTETYSVFGLWDSFRALHPLFTLTQQDRVPAIINSFLAFYDQYGLLPVWEMAFCETHCMTGYHAVPVIADAILKGIKGFDEEKAFEAMKASANQDIRNSGSYRRYGFIPFEECGANVTKTLEYAYDDWCIAMVAKKMGKEQDYREWIKRGGYWRNLFDASTKFSRPKYANGSWVPGFDPFNDHTNGKECYTEGNAWHYTFFVPHDVDGLLQAFGSREKFIEKLDSFFSSPYPKGNYLAGMGGIIGQYAHGNQPSHHIPYLYSYLGMPEKTEEILHHIMTNFYSNQPDGITGNEDTGGMSSWFVFNAMGFYPVNPCGGEYLLGTPLAETSDLSLANGHHFKIIARQLSNKNLYIQKVILNGVPTHEPTLRHETILKGGTLELIMGDRPSTEWGKKNASVN